MRKIYSFQLISPQILAYLGLIPFILALFAALFGFEALARKISLTYGAVIIAFMSGILWAVEIFSPNFKQKNFRPNLLIFSNILAILAFFVALFLINNLGIIIEISCFISLLLVEFFLQKKHQTFASNYFKMRVKVSLIVVTILGLILYFS